MCGIFCTIWRNENQDDQLSDYVGCKCMIQRRGPDLFDEQIQNLTNNWKARFAASVLWMQGLQPVAQPVTDSKGNLLLWNGDIFSGSLAQPDISDTQTLLNFLQANEDVPQTLKTVRGPYSLIYYRANQELLYFARDPIGRHSLLLKLDANNDSLTLSSLVNKNCKTAIEVPAVGIFLFNLKTSTLAVHPWKVPKARFKDVIKQMEIRLSVNITILYSLSEENGESPSFEPDPGEISYLNEIPVSVIESNETKLKTSDANIINIMQPEVIAGVMKNLSRRPEIRERISRVLELLRKSVELRINKKPEYCKNCVGAALNREEIVCGHSKLVILFSGGLDSTILAVLADEFVDKEEPIDLVNVAFEKARKIDDKQTPNSKNPKKCNEIVANFDVPDRKTGRQALAELQKICPLRKWNFLECNITQEELQKYRGSRIRDLVYPLSTILDDSLGCALWFASRGSGSLASTGEPYNSPARVLLLGMGADELFGGYTRHRTTLRRGGWRALTEELNEELARISERNLGRDDRVVSDHGRQSRLPFLDEDFVDYVSSLNPWNRCYPTETMPPGLGDKLLLRLVAHGIGLKETANFPKRAFQFGSRIANSKENAKDESKWL